MHEAFKLPSPGMLGAVLTDARPAVATLRRLGDDKGLGSAWHADPSAQRSLRTSLLQTCVQTGSAFGSPALAASSSAQEVDDEAQ